MASPKQTAPPRAERKPWTETTLMYVGPTIKIVAHATVFNNGLPDVITRAFAKVPALRELFVPIGGLSKVQAALKDPDSAYSRFAHAVTEAFKEE